MGKFLDLTGQKYGKLTAIQENSSTKQGKTWLCQCECGKSRIARADRLRSGSVQSCGCMRIRQEKKWKGCGEISGAYWSQIKDCASKRGVSFEITIEQSWNLFLKQGGKCAISNEPISFSRAYKKAGKVQTASLDRIDSTKGYTLDNIQWVHKRIQQMKWDSSQSDFVAWCYKVVKHNEHN